MRQITQIFISITFLIFSSCRDVKESEEYQKIALDRDSLVNILEAKELEVKEIATEFDHVEQNLSAIDTNKSKILRMGNKDFTKQKERIHSLIADIYIALDQNHNSIKALEKKLKNGSGNENLKMIISSMKKTLQVKEGEILILEKELSSLKLEVKNLQSAMVYKESILKEKDTLLAMQNQKLQKQEQIIALKEEELQKVFYIRGTTKELESAGIIKKEGGFVGLGTVKILGEKLGGDRMKILNQKKDQMLLIGRYKKKKVISTHPSDSYFFIAKEGQFYLKISYPDKFWSLSKYLVIAVD